MLLVHGFGISFAIWENLLPLLRSHFTLVMVELPGTGESPLPTSGQSYLGASVAGIERVRLALGFEAWDVLGYSVGTRVAEAYTQRHAAHVNAVIYLCPLSMDYFKFISLRMALWVDQFIPAFGNFILSGWRLKFLISLFGFNLHPNPAAGEWFTEISAKPMYVLKEMLRMLAMVGRHPFDRMRLSAFLWGDGDIIPARPRKFGTGDYLIHTNHAALVLAAEEVAGVIIEFLQPFPV